MQSKLMIALTILAVMIFASGASCQRTGNEAVEAPFNGGIEGLTIEFFPIGTVSDNIRGAEVWEDDSFAIEATIMNKGEYTIGAHDVLLEIKGISPDDFTGITFETTNDEEIEKVTQFLQEGGETYVNFGDAKFKGLTGTFYDANLYVYFTYPYEQYVAIPKVCYKQDIRDDSLCTVDESKQAFISGGPFAIGSVQEKYIGKGKLSLEIPIRNVGGGKAKVFEGDDFDPNFDEVSFVVNTPGWECRSRGSSTQIRLVRPSANVENPTEETLIICTNRNLEENALYTKQVDMTLRYWYQDKAYQKVRIVENPE